jgi:hypothetical protein
MTGGLPIVDDATWERMSWRARQQWLLAANALRRQMTAELVALARDERSRRAHERGRRISFDVLVADGDLLGADRLAEAEAEAWNLSTAPDHAASA